VSATNPYRKQKGTPLLHRQASPAEWPIALSPH